MEAVERVSRRSGSTRSGGRARRRVLVVSRLARHEAPSKHRRVPVLFRFIGAGLEPATGERQPSRAARREAARRELSREAGAHTEITRASAWAPRPVGPAIQLLENERAVRPSREGALASEFAADFRSSLGREDVAGCLPLNPKVRSPRVAAHDLVTAFARRNRGPAL